MFWAWAGCHNLSLYHRQALGKKFTACCSQIAALRCESLRSRSCCFFCVFVFFFPLDLASCLGGKKNVFILMSKSDFLTSLLVSTAAPWKLLRTWFPSSEKNKIFFYHMSNCTLNGFKNSHVVQKSLSLIAPFLRFNEPFRNYVCCWLDVCAAADFLFFFFAGGCERRATLEVVRFFFIGWWSWDEKKINNGNLKTLRFDG